MINNKQFKQDLSQDHPFGKPVEFLSAFKGEGLALWRRVNEQETEMRKWSVMKERMRDVADEELKHSWDSETIAFT